MPYGLKTCKLLCRCVQFVSGNGLVYQELLACPEYSSRLTRSIYMEAFLKRRQFTMFNQNNDEQVSHGGRISADCTHVPKDGQEADPQTQLHSGSTCDWLNCQRHPTHSLRLEEDDTYLKGRSKCSPLGFFPIYAFVARAGQLHLDSGSANEFLDCAPPHPWHVAWGTIMTLTQFPGKITATLYCA